MTSMIEKVARAIEPDIHWDVPDCLLPRPASHWTKLQDETQEKAKAALEAMMEPTEAMIKAAHEYDCKDTMFKTYAGFHHAMIKAALEEE